MGSSPSPPFPMLTAQRQKLIERLTLARRIAQKKTVSGLSIENLTDIEESWKAAERNLDQTLQVVFFGNRSTQKTPLLYSILGISAAANAHTYRLEPLSLPEHKLVFLDTPGLDAPQQELQMARPDTLKAVGNADIVVLTVATPDNRAVEELLTGYTSARDISLRSRDHCVIWSPRAKLAEAVRDRVSGVKVGHTYIFKSEDLHSAVNRLGPELDSQFSELLTAQVMFPARAPVSPPGADSGWLSQCYTGFIGTAHQKLTEYTRDNEGLSQRINQLEKELAATSSKQDSDPQSEELLRTLNQLKQNRRALEFFLTALTPICNAIPTSAADAGAIADTPPKTGAPYPKYAHRDAAKKVFDDGWDSFLASVRDNCWAIPGDLLVASNRSLYVLAAAERARTEGNSYLSAWILGEFGSQRWKPTQTHLFSALCLMSEANYKWAQLQWSALPLPSGKAPTQPTMLQSDLKARLTATIPLDTNNWSQLSAINWRNASLGFVGGGIGSGGLTLGAAKFFAPLAPIDWGLTAALAGLGALVFGAVAYVWSKKKRRADAQHELDKIVRDRFMSEFEAYKETAREQFCLAASKAYQDFEDNARNSATAYQQSLDQQIAQIDEQIKDRQTTIKNEQNERRMKMADLKVELHRLGQKVDELKNLVSKVKAELESITVENLGR